MVDIIRICIHGTSRDQGSSKNKKNCSVQIEATNMPETVPRNSAAVMTAYYSYMYSLIPLEVLSPTALKQPYSQTFS